VDIRMIVRGIFCAYSENDKYKKPMRAISIVDEYLEHSRVMIFHNGGKEKVYISSADWMVRNLDHRVEAACPIMDEGIRQELKDVLKIQLSDNVKARILDNQLSNAYVPAGDEKIRSQIEVQHYLISKIPKAIETGSH
jgi:polyphosphate kinase